MKITLSIDDTLMRRVREEAARRQTTISELVEAGLRLVLAEPSVGAASDALAPLPSWRGGQPLVDVSDRDALYRVMEGAPVVGPPSGRNPSNTSEGRLGGSPA